MVEDKNRAIEFHDSTLAGIEEADGKIVVSLDKAYVHESEGVTEVDKGTGWVQAIDLVFTDATVVVKPDSIPTKISDGQVGPNSDGGIDLPIEIHGHVEIRFVTAENEELKIIANGLRTKVVGVAEYVEDFEP